MAKQEPLFDLIQSLSQTEKRYFKLHSSMQFPGEQKNYVQLFELIEKQARSASGYDEDLILKQMQVKYFSQLKRHLHTKIMESLRAYHAGESIDVQVHAHIQDFEILLQKSLYRQSRKSLDRARKLAEKHERFTEIIRINKLETKLLRAENDLDRLDRHIEQAHGDLDNIVQRIESEIAFDKAFVHIIKFNKEFEFVRSAKELAVLQEILEQQIPKTDPDSLSVDARLKHFYIHGLYWFFVADFERSAEWFGKHLSCIEDNDWIIQEQMPTYVRALGNNALLHLKLNKYDVFKASLEKLQNIKQQPQQIQAYIDYSSYMFRLMYHTQIGEFSEAVKCVDSERHHIDKIQHEITEKDILYVERTYVLFKTMIAYLGTGELRKALRILNEFLNSADTDLKQDSYCVARIINLFIHYELGNADLLEYNLKSTYRFLNKKERLYQFETVMMNFVKKALDINNPKELAAAFKTLKAEIEPLAQQEFERNVFDHFDFISWLNAKIEGRSFADVVQKSSPALPK